MDQTMRAFWDVFWPDAQALVLFAVPALLACLPLSALGSLLGAVGSGLGSCQVGSRMEPFDGELDVVRIRGAFRASQRGGERAAVPRGHSNTPKTELPARRESRRLQQHSMRTMIPRCLQEQ